MSKMASEERRGAHFKLGLICPYCYRTQYYQEMNGTIKLRLNLKSIVVFAHHFHLLRE